MFDIPSCKWVVTYWWGIKAIKYLHWIGNKNKGLGIISGMYLGGIGGMYIWGINSERIWGGGSGTSICKKEGSSLWGTVSK